MRLAYASSLLGLQADKIAITRELTATPLVDGGIETMTEAGRARMRKKSQIFRGSFVNPGSDSDGASSGHRPPRVLDGSRVLDPYILTDGGGGGNAPAVNTSSGAVKDLMGSLVNPGTPSGPLRPGGGTTQDDFTNGPPGEQGSGGTESSGPDPI